MTKNVGAIDRSVRIIAGVVLLGIAVFGGQWWGWLGVVPLVTAFAGVCPAYRLFGLTTCPIASKQI